MINDFILFTEKPIEKIELFRSWENATRSNPLKPAGIGTAGYSEN